MKYSKKNNVKESNELVPILHLTKNKRIIIKKFIVVFFSFLLFILFILVFYIIYNNIFFQVKQMKLFKFMDIFPKINSNETISNIENLFQSRELFINDNNITNEYIYFIRPINEAQEKNNISEKKYENIKPYGFWKNPRPNQYNRTEFYNLCRKEQLLDIQKNEYSNKPVISVKVYKINQ